MTMSQEKFAIQVTEPNGTVIPLGDVVGATADEVRTSVRHRVQARRSDLPPTGEVSCSDGSTDIGRLTVEQMLRSFSGA